MTEKPKPPSDVLQVADYLINNGESQLRLRQGVLNGNRANFFKGKHAVNAILRESYKKSKNRPEILDREGGEQMMKKLLANGMIFRVGKEPKSTILTITNEQEFLSDGYYIFLYQGSQLPGMLLGVGILVVIFAGVLYPLWPPFMRQGAYYFSMLMMFLLGLLMALGVFRAILWLVLKIATGRGGWLYPNLFADVGIIESFYPLWKWDDEVKKKKRVKKE